MRLWPAAADPAAAAGIPLAEVFEAYECCRRHKRGRTNALASACGWAWRVDDLEGEASHDRRRHPRAQSPPSSSAPLAQTAIEGMLADACRPLVS